MLRHLWPIWIVAVYGLILSGTAQIGTPSGPVPKAPVANLLDKPFGEDAFYMFSVARSIAAGRGIAYGDTPTTGIQPLATFLYASLYWLADRAGLSDTAPLRLILIANVTLLILTAFLSGSSSRDGRAAGRCHREVNALAPSRIVSENVPPS